MTLDNPSSQRFPEERGSAIQVGNKYLGNELYRIVNEQGADRQFDWFVLNKAAGLTQAGLSRINQSIEAFVYCVLGAQVNLRSGIIGDVGRAREAQTEFLVLLEDAIRQANLSKSVQRYQLAVDEAKVRLNLAVAPGTWLMPARIVINPNSVTGYNNQLRQATPNMKLGVNNSVNLGTKNVGVKLMNGGSSKINRPTSHPPNPIHSQVKQQTSKTDSPTSYHAEVQSQVKQQTPKDSDSNHEILKAGLIIGGLISAFMVYQML